ncbi:hypothetical protein [Neisseria sp. HMSC70E02]|uniref:hypothetical protein n=1 Tax=Neisseria sp. HMSC70E02 TaxID=1608896 RepID=UPI0008A980FE|nr:hypothetical protein [Neisseria sp. HMSC70E02]OHR78403.1 hypothetical protein HMPREF3277_01380 [Neisseria sp. HMSC70E02]
MSASLCEWVSDDVEGRLKRAFFVWGRLKKGRGVSDDVCDGAVFSTVACVAGYTVFAADARQYGNEGQILLRRGFKVV